MYSFALYRNKAKIDVKQKQIFIGLRPGGRRFCTGRPLDRHTSNPVPHSPARRVKGITKIVSTFCNQVRLIFRYNKTML